jgi:hypothetical protein
MLAIINSGAPVSASTITNLSLTGDERPRLPPSVLEAGGGGSGGGGPPQSPSSRPRDRGPKRERSGSTQGVRFCVDGVRFKPDSSHRAAPVSEHAAPDYRSSRSSRAELMHSRNSGGGIN